MPVGRITKIIDIQDFSVLPTFADNTSAILGGLSVGDLYKTSIGQLMVVI